MSPSDCCLPPIPCRCGCTTPSRCSFWKSTTQPSAITATRGMSSCRNALPTCARPKTPSAWFTICAGRHLPCAAGRTCAIERATRASSTWRSPLTPWSFAAGRQCSSSFTTSPNVSARKRPCATAMLDTERSWKRRSTASSPWTVTVASSSSIPRRNGRSAIGSGTCSAGHSPI